MKKPLYLISFFSIPLLISEHIVVKLWPCQTLGCLQSKCTLALSVLIHSAAELYSSGSSGSTAGMTKAWLLTWESQVSNTVFSVLQLAGLAWQSIMVLSFWAKALYMIFTTYGEDEMFLTGIRKRGGETFSLPIHWEKWAELASFQNGPALRRWHLCPYTNISLVISGTPPSGPLGGTGDTSCPCVSLGLTPTPSSRNLTELRCKRSTEQLGQVFAWAKMKPWCVQLSLKPKMKDLKSSLGSRVPPKSWVRLTQPFVGSDWQRRRWAASLPV